MRSSRISVLLGFSVLASCQVKPYAPPPERVVVDNLEVKVSHFQGRPEAYALVKGRLSTSVAQLVDTKQSRDGGTLYLEVLEQTPRGANRLTGVTENPPFEKQVPLELIGLSPGVYRLVANTRQAVFEIPASHPEESSSPPYSDGRQFEDPTVGEWIDIEDTDLVEPTR